MTLVLAVLSSVAILLVVAVRPRVRTARASLLRERIAELVGHAPVVQPDGELERAAREMLEVSRIARESEQRARGLRIPIPEEPSANASTDQALRGLAAVLQDPKVAVAVAGGEQLLANIVDMAGPETWGHIVAAGHELAASHVLDPLAAGGLAEGVAQATLDTAKTFMADGAQGVVHAAHESLGHLKEAAHQATAAFDPSHAAGFHFPVATLVLSSWRELNLLFDEKTTAFRSVAHVAIDTASTAAGALGGAKAGALAGAIFGPIGAAIGGVVGGIAGGVGGRLVANEVKHAPLHKAVEGWEGCVSTSKGRIHSSAIQAARSARERALAAQARYERSIDPAPSVREGAWGAVLEREVRRIAASHREHARARLAEIGRLENHLRRDLPRDAWLHRISGTAVRAMLASEVGQAAGAARSAWDAHIRGLPQSGHDEPLEMLLAYAAASVNDQELRKGNEAVAHRIGEVSTTYTAAVQAWGQKVAASYRSAVIEASAAAEQEGRRHVEVTQECRGLLDAAAGEVRRHQLALGLA